MKIISFAYTTAALLAGHKTVTRRYWNPRHANMFKPGETVQAWDKSPRFGGKKVAEIKIIAIYQENSKDMPDEHYAKEGFQYMLDNKIPIGKRGKYPIWTDESYWRAWKGAQDDVYVVEFELIKVL